MARRITRHFRELYQELFVFFAGADREICRVNKHCVPIIDLLTYQGDATYARISGASGLAAGYPAACPSPEYMPAWSSIHASILSCHIRSRSSGRRR